MMAASGTSGRSGDGRLAFGGGADRVGFARELGLGLGEDHRAVSKPGGLRALEEAVSLFDLVAGLPWPYGGDPAGARATCRLGRARHGRGVPVVPPALCAE